jgi:hypothetical protein
MLRKALAVLLVFSWVILSGFDLLEDFDLPIQIGVHQPLGNSPPSGGPGVDLVNNLLESGDRTRFSYVGLLALSVVDSSVDRSTVSKKVSKIHKLHRVFLI